MRQLVSATDSMDMNLSKIQGIVEDRGAWHATVHGFTESDTTEATQQQQQQQFFASGGQSIVASASTSALPMNTQD